MKFAVIDIETTGLHPLSNRITEIGIVFIENGIITKRYEKLFYPEENLPHKISLLTGLTNAILENAPLFIEHAVEIDKLTSGYRIVAHHVNFDYSFVKQEMKRSGISWTRKTMCTAELTRFFYPLLPSYSLSALTKYFDVINKRPHRAMSDAEATAQILLRIMSDHGSSKLEEILLSERKDYLIPAHLDDKIRNQLPSKPGVYYFIGRSGKPVYIGKASKIKSRVLSHFRGGGNSLKILALGKQIKDIRFELTGDERLASLLEDHEIRHYWPVLNKSQKSNVTRFGIVAYRSAPPRPPPPSRRVSRSPWSCTSRSAHRSRSAPSRRADAGSSRSRAAPSPARRFAARCSAAAPTGRSSAPTGSPSSTRAIRSRPMPAT
jgi:DNA polymerase-3 subunit epsilon